MPTKRLPAQADIIHLKHQAKDLLRAQRAARSDGLQRIREFHPKHRGTSDSTIAAADFTLSDAQQTIAREYGFKSWPRLRQVVADAGGVTLDLLHHERIEDPLFRQAVDLLDEGQTDRLRALLQQHPELAHQRIVFEGENYFGNPSLLEFIAENPIRHGRMPANIVEMAEVILDAGAKEDKTRLTETLGLVASSCVARDCGLQNALIARLCSAGADADGAMMAALAHGEFAAAEALLAGGARLDLVVAAATGREALARQVLPTADALVRHRALAMAAQHGHASILRLLLEAGEDPDRYNPEGCHMHTTPLHQAAYGGFEEAVKALVEAGARLDMKDILFKGTPLGWALHGGREKIAAYLREEGAA